MDFNFKVDAQTAWQFLAGVGGSFAGLRAIPGKGLIERFMTLNSGVMFAIFLGPGLAEWLHFETIRLQALVIFATGAVGLVAFGAFIDGIKATPIGTIITETIRAWLPKPKGE